MNISTPYVIETQCLSKTYKEAQALQSLDLKVQPNSICGFLGPNGVGKVFGLDIVKENDQIRGN
jgi:ABC-type multidrug transport system ATPase subunit